MYWEQSRPRNGYRLMKNAGFELGEARLRSHRINPDYCPVCGYHFGFVPPEYKPAKAFWQDPDREHDCNVERSKLQAWAVAGIPFRHWKFDWDAAEPTELTRAVDRYLEDFKQNVGDGMGIMTLGPYGVGKTTALCQVLKHALATGRTALMEKFEDVLQLYKRKPEYQQMLVDVEVLLIDEVEILSKDSQRSVYAQYSQLISKRYDAVRPTLIAGNAMEQEFAQAYPEVYSRLHECSYVITPPAQDFRQLAADVA